MNISLSEFDALFSTSDSDLLLTLIWILPLFIFVMYGQRIQLAVTSREIKKSITKLLKMREDARTNLAKYAKELSKDDSSENIAALSDYFTISPVGLDPAGIVPKIRQLVRSKEDTLRSQIEILLDTSDQIQISRILVLVEIASSLQMVHKSVNHLYLTAKKQNNYPLILPLQMVLPTLMEEAKAMRDAIDAFELGQPIGDGIGPLVAAHLMNGLERIEASKETDLCKTKIDGVDVCIIKARGPMASVGRLADAIDFAISKYGVPDAIITVDAAKKLEGEDSGEIVRGFGVAMGGIGTERFQIEQAATEHGIGTYAVIVKQSVKEALTLMTKEISEKTEQAIESTKQSVKDVAPNGGSVFIVGVGNTSGVP